MTERDKLIAEIKRLFPNCIESAIDLADYIISDRKRVMRGKRKGYNNICQDCGADVGNEIFNICTSCWQDRLIK